jgi:predicted PolB exonuclease-like 3'-5' exonuclease
MICIFDCETIPDVALARSEFDIEGSDFEVSKRAFEIQEEKNGYSFLPLPFHQVVAISAVITDDFGKFEKVSSIHGENEKEMIENFLNFINKKEPKLVSFNGRAFDMPMLMVRAMKYNLSCPAYFEKENRELNKSKWDNYRSRYSDRFHVDLMDHIGEFGAVRGLKLDTLCKMAGLPGKYDVHGDEVTELYYNQETKKIKEYCESDVLNTYWLYLKYELLKGNLMISDYAMYLENFQEKLDTDKSYTDIFKKYIEEEIKRIDK